MKTDIKFPKFLYKLHTLSFPLVYENIEESLALKFLEKSSNIKSIEIHDGKLNHSFYEKLLLCLIRNSNITNLTIFSAKYSKFSSILDSINSPKFSLLLTYINHTNIEGLSIYNHNFNNENLKHILYQIGKSKVSNLDLSYCKLDDDEFEFFCNHLPVCKKINHLSLRQTSLNNAKIEFLTSLLATNKNIVSLDISTNNLSECSTDNLYLLCNINNLSNLKNLNISSCNLNDSLVLNSLFNTIKPFNNLENIYLGGNNFSNTSISHIANSLTLSENIKTLGLNSMGLGQLGTISISNLIALSKINEIIISAHNNSEKNLKMLLKTLQEYPNTKIIFSDKSQISSKTVKQIYELYKSREIKSFEIELPKSSIFSWAYSIFTMKSSSKRSDEINLEPIVEPEENSKIESSLKYC